MGHRIRGFRRRLGLALLLLGALPAGATAPQRIVSSNLCTDRLVLALATPGRVLSVSSLTADPLQSTMVEATRGLILNHGDAEEIAALHPDLVVFGRYGGAAAGEMLQQLGIPVYRADWPTSLAGMQDSIRALAARLGVPERGAQLAAAIARRLDDLSSRSHPARRTVVYSAGGWTHGRGSIDDDLLGRLGLINVAAEAGITGNGTLPLEALVALAPDLIVIEGLGSRQPSLQAQLLDHPALNQDSIRRLEMPMKLWACADTALLDAAQLILDAAPSGTP
jgi:iron complex transport system substrate-binding protein